MRILALSAVLWLALASPGEAAQTGKDLKAICEDQTPNLQGVCVGYILGIADIMTQFSHDGGYFLGFRACMPEISVVQAQGVPPLVRERGQRRIVVLMVQENVGMHVERRRIHVRSRALAALRKDVHPTLRERLALPHDEHQRDHREQEEQPRVGDEVEESLYRFHGS